LDISDIDITKKDKDEEDMMKDIDMTEFEENKKPT
jgi:hypothetical protein